MSGSTSRPLKKICISEGEWLKNVTHFSLKRISSPPHGAPLPPNSPNSNRKQSWKNKRKEGWGPPHSAPLLWLPIIADASLWHFRLGLGLHCRIHILRKCKQTCISLWTNINHFSQSRSFFKNQIHFWRVMI